MPRNDDLSPVAMVAIILAGIVALVLGIVL